MHSFDLMALDSNVQLNKLGSPLPHFTPWPTPLSNGVNLFAQDLNDESLDMRNPYVFPPFCLIAPVLRFLFQFRVPFTIVVPDIQPRQFWWPMLAGSSSQMFRLCSAGESDVLLFPSKCGFSPRPSSFALLVCRVSKF